MWCIVTSCTICYIRYCMWCIVTSSTACNIRYYTFYIFHHIEGCSEYWIIGLLKHRWFFVLYNRLNTPLSFSYSIVNLYAYHGYNLKLILCQPRLPSMINLMPPVLLKSQPRSNQPSIIFLMPHPKILFCFLHS